MGNDSRHVESSRIMLSQLGFACYVTVMGRALRDVSVLFAWAGHQGIWAVLTPNIANVLALFATAFICSRRKIPFLGRVSGIVSVLSFTVGFLAVAGTYLAGTCPPPLLLLVGVLFGLGGALGMTGWVGTFFREGGRAACEILSASLIACVIGFALGVAEDIPAVCVLCIALAIMAEACSVGLRSPRLSLPEGEGERGFSWDRGVVRAFTEVWPAALCIGALGFMSAVARGMLGTQAMASVLSITMLGEVVSCFLLVFLFTLGTLRAEVISIYKVLFPVGALSFVVLTFVGGQFVVVLAAVAEFSFSLCSVLMSLQIIDYCHRLRIPPTVVAGVFSGLMHSVLSFGYLVPSGADGVNESLYPVIGVVVIFVLAMAQQLASRRQGIAAEATSMDAGHSPELGFQTGKVARARDVAAVALPKGYESIELSCREGEVLARILQGRDVPFIAEDLGVSKNTVRTYVKSLYAKFDVHARQQLIDVFREG